MAAQRAEREVYELLALLVSLQSPVETAALPPSEAEEMPSVPARHSAVPLATVCGLADLESAVAARPVVKSAEARAARDAEAVCRIAWDPVVQSAAVQASPVD